MNCAAAAVGPRHSVACIATHHRDVVIGNLDEEYRRTIVALVGTRRAALWSGDGRLPVCSLGSAPSRASTDSRCAAKRTTHAATSWCAPAGAGRRSSLCSSFVCTAARLRSPHDRDPRALGVAVTVSSVTQMPANRFACGHCHMQCRTHYFTSTEDRDTRRSPDKPRHPGPDSSICATEQSLTSVAG